MKTITLQIGNTDNKLTQQEWSVFCGQVNDLVNAYTSSIYFKGCPPTWESWQNCAWIFDTETGRVRELKEKLSVVRERWLQNSVAWTEGVTEFV